MLKDATILRLIISQVISVYFLLILIPIKEPIRKHKIIVISCATLITLANALIILYIGLSFYVSNYFFTLLLPYLILFLILSVYKGAKLIFALLSIQVIGNVAIINGLMASYVFYGENNPMIDTIARVITHLIFLPIVLKFIRPTYLKMAKMLDKGWWILNASLILSYALAYVILFIPDNVFNRPEYFLHAYIGIILSLCIYAIIFFLFIEIQIKTDTERDKQILSIQFKSLSAQSEEIHTIAYNDSLTGAKNRYSLFKHIDKLIQKKESFLVVFIDLDDLKRVNDTYDHSKGDAYLKQFATALKNEIKDQGEVYRFAGDEFICLWMHDCARFDSVQFKENVAKKMISDIPFYGLSLGVARYPQQGLNADDLINFADQAMYAEKKEKIIRRSNQ